MVNIKILMVGLVLLAVSVLFMAPMIGVELPFVLPAIGPQVMGMSAAGIGFGVLGVILFIVGIRSY